MTKQDNEYISKTLNYKPVIENDWKETNEISPATNIIEQPNAVTPMPEVVLDDEHVLKSTITDNVIPIVNAAISSLDGIKNVFVESNMDYSYTLDAINHALKFWRIVNNFAKELDYTEQDIIQYKDLLDSKNTMSSEASAAINSAQVLSPDSDEYITTYATYRKAIDNLTALETDIDSKRTRCYICSDMNKAISYYASNCAEMCRNMAMAPSSEGESLKLYAQRTFNGIDKDYVSRIESLMTPALEKEVAAMNRVMSCCTDETTMIYHFNDVNDLISVKTDVIPGMKHILRNNQINSDFTNMVINDMLDKSKEIDEKYVQAVTNTIKYMHAENTVLLKTFANELKINRFSQSLQYIK